MDENEIAARAEWVAAREVEAPNLRDFYPNRDAYEAAIAAWHARIDAAQAAVGEAIRERMARLKASRGA